LRGNIEIPSHHILNNVLLVFYLHNDYIADTVDENELTKNQNNQVLRMTKAELIDTIVKQQSHLAHHDVELAVKCMLEHMSQTLASGRRIEIRGFGSFSLHYRSPRRGRNPKTGASVVLTGKHVPHFKPGKELKDRVNSEFHGELGKSI